MLLAHQVLNHINADDTSTSLLHQSINSYISFLTIITVPPHSEPLSHHSPYCPTCGCPSPMASPVHSSAPASPAPQSPSTPSSSNPTGPRGRRAKRKRLATVNDEINNNNNDVDNHDNHSDNNIHSDGSSSSSDETLEVNCDDDVLASHLRHMEAREQFDEFQGRVPLRCKPIRITRSSDRASQR